MIRKFNKIIANALFFPVVSDRFWSWIKKELFLKLIMRTFIFLFCLSLFSLTPKHILSQNDKIVIDADKIISVDEIFKIIKSQTDYSFVYHENLFKDFPQVQLKKGAIRLNKLLNQCFSVDNINIIFSANNTILIKEKKNSLQVQQRKVSGKVTDPAGFPIPGATVLIKGTTKGTATDIDGNYTITVPDPANVLVFSSLGFEAKEITVGNHLPAGLPSQRHGQAGTTINISLKEDVNELDVVTISGRYYNTSQREETGSVGSIDAKIIEKQLVNNPLAAMQGHVSGVNISQTGGLSGGSFDIEIRGRQDLVTVNSPLYIVDGIPYDSGTLEDPTTTLAAFIIPNGKVSPLNTINPSDIESIQVLKDADATAIYGSRGANGVVIITTKKGREGKTQIKLNVSTTLSEVGSFVDLLNTEQYLEVRREALMNDGNWPLAQTPTNELSFPDLLLWDQDRYTDWQEVLIGGTAYRQNVQLSFSGGSEQTQFLLSGGYVNETTVFPGDAGYKKATIRLSINHQSEDERFNINTSVNYGTDTNNLPSSDLTRVSRTLAPNAPALYKDDGSLNWEGSTWDNPLAVFETTYNAVSNSLIANTVLSYRPIPDLEFKASLGYTDNRLNSYGTIPHTFYDPFLGYDSSRSLNRTNEGTRNSWIVEPQINWGHSWGNASIKLLLGSTFQNNKGHQLLMSGRGFSSNELIDNLSSATNQFIEIDDNSEYKYQSVFGRININWQDKYILNLTGRRDGSSRFGPGKRYGSFGAMGVAWLFSKEPFLKDHTFLSFGKFRASYGTAGSDGTGNYQFYDSYSTHRRDYNGSGLEPTSLFNPDYAWAETRKLETALELGFFKDRIFLTTAWYQNRSSNQLINAPLPLITGFSGVNGNWGAVVQNAGIEIDLRSVNIQNDDFKWSTTFNISANRNKLVAFPGLEGSAWDGEIKIGSSIRSARQYNFLGIDPETGVYQFEDYNKDGVLNFQDRYLFEDLAPKYFGGLGNMIEYKGLQLNVFLQFVKQKGTKYWGAISSGQFAINAPKTVLDRWQQPGDQNPIQRYSVLNSNNKEWEFYQYSTAGRIDRSFIRLRNVSLNYTIPKAFTKGLDINLFLQGQNLLVISRFDGADPEVTSTIRLPPLRQFTLGLNLGF